MSGEQLLIRVLGIGIGATVLLDVWLMLLRRWGVPTLNFALLGRWVGHLPRGRWRHPSIGAALPVRHELALGWVSHYAIGVMFAALLVVWAGERWLQHPEPVAAVLLGLATAVAPLFLMQPAMGAGVAGRRTGVVWKNVLRALANHLVFGLGLYLAALALYRLA